MKRAGSLRWRLLAGAVVWIALALSAASWLLSGLFADHVARRFDAELMTELDQLTASIDVDAAGRPVLTRALADPRFEQPLSGRYWQVTVGRAGEPALRSRSLWDERIALAADVLAPGTLHRHRVDGPRGQTLLVLERGVVLPDFDQRLRLSVAADAGELEATTRAFDAPLRLSLAVLALALVAAALVQVEVGLRPLRRLREELAAVRAGRRKRFEESMPQEIAPLVDDLNALLAHEEEVVGRARLQAGNLAHALKTQLAVLANEAAALAPTNAREVGPRIARQVEVMRRHIDHHMARARAAASAGLPGMRVEVAPAAEALARTLEKLYADRALDVEATVPAGRYFAGEPQDLDEMLGNLIENACQWARTRVHVHAEDAGPGRFALLVDDDGPGLADAERERVLVPGVRLDETTPGSGLGLAVVRDLAELYGGGIALERAPQGGVRARLVLPRAPD